MAPKLSRIFLELVYNVESFLAIGANGAGRIFSSATNTPNTVNIMFKVFNIFNREFILDCC